MRTSDELARKVLLHLGKSPEDAVMTFAEDGSTWRELIDLARKVQESEQLTLPKAVADLSSAVRGLKDER